MDGSGIFDGTIVAKGICHDCFEWEGGSLDVNSSAQPFTYAVGPDRVRLDSNAIDAGLRRHEHYGQFTMDMVAATGDNAGFPGDISKDRKSTTNGKDENDYDYGSTTHAVFMVVVFVIVFPFGAAYLRLNNVLWHWIMQTIGILGAIVGIGVGVNISQEYNRVSSARARKPWDALLTTLIVKALFFGTSAHWVACTHSHIGPVGVWRDTPHDSL